ncbi:hypothetical protein QQS21_008813 [Conoideocrella luteorostrata]|uniref:Uncharacterized protein n=1 Tax=Conoideocrella luteorostrata TaxID=1105319 RepID=A0AAJ0CKW7_9HYPO|nr:hypothetical protein QQS21_008813 [Conoideocrella luteorostrata]
MPTANGLPTSSGDDIVNKRVFSPEELSNSADVSLSGGSDTEASRADWSTLKDADKGHERSASSTKKPTTFKAVSVNKTFLASKASPGGVVTKPIDKPTSGSGTPPPGTSSSSSSRPRLIAKTGSSARDAAPRLSSIINGAKATSGPDPNVVWNKNRRKFIYAFDCNPRACETDRDGIIVAPEPKKFTDEELKKYGIHMASRLNEDDAQGQGKWADIDDDDEDWAPEAITWGDGTKTTLPHLDEQPASVQTTSSPLSVTKLQPKPKSPAPSTAVRSPISRPGGLATGRGLVLKPASQEKPALIAKPAAPVTPAKSPWATLPPVDRASPGLVETAALPHGQPRETTFTKPLHQPKEIAADDFTRSSWRESSSYGSRELYNSQSGRYEPVTDRRGSFKSEPQTRHPALLQRPHPLDQVTETQGLQQVAQMPQDGPYIRRRGSSSVSTGSASLQQRGAKNSDVLVPPADTLRTNRLSFANSTESPDSQGDGSSLNALLSKDQMSQPQVTNSPPGRISATLSTGTTSSDTKDFPPQSSNDAVVEQMQYQKKLMRERNELARKRRQEEEALEEAAKKERIQKKLDALGPPPERKGDKKECSPGVELSRPTHIQQRERRTSSDTLTSPMTETLSALETGASSTIPGRPDRPQSSTKPQSSNTSLSQSTTFRRLSHGHESRRSDPWGGTGPRPDRFSSWGSAVPPSLRNVWGSPDNDRGLGNGTFNPDLGRVTNSSTTPSPNPKGPSPIAPPNASTRASSHSRSQATQVTSVNSKSPIYGPPGSELASKWVSSTAENDQKLSTTILTERVGRERQLMEKGMTMEDSQPVIKDTWRPIHAQGDGTRHTIGTVDVQSHQPVPWKSTKDGPQNGPTVKVDSASSTKAGVIGSSTPSQSRPSRFFPTREVRHETTVETRLSRPTSPTPPPPTMEGHPAYEGDVMRPHVSLPKPQPVVKLPPALISTQLNQTRPNNPWTTRVAMKDSQRDHGSCPGGEGIWQARIHKLLHGDRPSSVRDVGIDASSRGPLDPVGYQTSATVLLPSAVSATTDNTCQFLVSKPMAEECFEEQEMGSLPQIRLPHKAPEAAWQPATAQAKALPKKFLVQAALMEPFQLPSDSYGGLVSINVLFPGMKETKAVSLPTLITRGSRGSHGQRSTTRHRGFSAGLRGGKKETPGSHDSEMTPSRSGRGSRAGYRGRASDSWTRQQSSQSQNPTKS